MASSDTGHVHLYTSKGLDQTLSSHQRGVAHNIRVHDLDETSSTHITSARAIMGWINQGQLRHPPPRSPRTLNHECQGPSSSARGEDKSVSSSAIEDRDFPFCPKNLANGELPSIPAAVVAQHSGNNEQPRLWIVVDEVVYDCSTWVDEHPGGDSVIRSFGGQDCSWQFWRFHNNKDMANYGLALRIGRTQGVENRYPEPKRYSRLRGFDAEDW